VWPAPTPVFGLFALVVRRPSNGRLPFRLRHSRHIPHNDAEFLRPLLLLPLLPLGVSMFLSTPPPSAIGIGPDETAPADGNFLGSKLHEPRPGQFSAAKPTSPPPPLTTTTDATSATSTKEMFYDDFNRALALLELEDDEAEEKDQHHHDEQDIPVVMMISSKFTDHRPLPSLASSLCSLSEGVREEEDFDFTQLSDRASKVAFSTVKVRQYTITIGDHPCCNAGYALSLDWDYETLPDQSLEAFEAGHGQRRNRLELLTSYEERRSRLEECCCFDNDDSGDALKRLNRRLERQKCRNRRAVDSFFT
jgi:hypothetical protein